MSQKGLRGGYGHQGTSGAVDAGRLRLRIHSGSVLARCRPEWVVFYQVQQSDSGWYEMQVSFATKALCPLIVAGKKHLVMGFFSKLRLPEKNSVQAETYGTFACWPAGCHRCEPRLLARGCPALLSKEAVEEPLRKQQAFSQRLEVHSGFSMIFKSMSYEYDHSHAVSATQTF